jgi:hypothetical protein
MNNANAPAMPNHLDTLRLYQAWRRDNEGKTTMPDARAVGEALDWAIAELDKPEWAKAGDNTLHGAIDHWQAEAAKYRALCRELADELEPIVEHSIDIDLLLAKYKEHTQ